MANLPLITCLMPTYNRRKFIPQAIKYFLRQDYEEKELVILDDGKDEVYDLVPQKDNIRYVRLTKKVTIGTKLNIGMEYANGAVIAKWDDDDWYAPRRLSYQVQAMQESGIEVCGLNNLLYYDLIKKEGYRYIYPLKSRIWLSGSALCFSKNIFQQYKFDNINVGEDGSFARSVPRECVKVLDDSTFTVLTIHRQNVSPKHPTGSLWNPYPAKQLQEIVGNDWEIFAKR